MQHPRSNPLAEHLRDVIRRQGPITIARYMEDALSHPRYGYYVQKDPLGRAGDFTTAPEMTQVFGELIGAWCATIWHAMGGPALVRLVELGPGRGTFMADLLRAVKGEAAFLKALQLHFVEASPVLRRRQGEALAAAGLESRSFWHRDVSQLPGGPMILIANEFFDALPIRQFERSPVGPSGCSQGSPWARQPWFASSGRKRGPPGPPP